MALVDRTHTRLSAQTFSPDDMISGLAARFARWRTYRRTLAELQALDDRTLADFGWSRAGLPGVAREAVGR
ncbi:MAG: DUF1127 domain-containing protein [Paracoccaceae bacterium]